MVVWFEWDVRTRVRAPHDVALTKVPQCANRLLLRPQEVQIVISLFSRSLRLSRPFCMIGIRSNVIGIAFRLETELQNIP